MYNPTANAWSSISPADGSARGVLPVLTSSVLGFELGPILRLQDGRAFVIGANGHTALYEPSTNTWAGGPDTPSGFGADDAPAAETPNGHIVYAADNVPAGLFNPPTKIFEFNPIAETTVEVTPDEDPNLSFVPSFVTRMLTLPTGQVLFADSSEQLWVYTGDGVPNPALRPVVNNVAYSGGAIFTLTGKRLNGQSAAASYGDDAESDENYPVVRLTSFNRQRLLLSDVELEYGGRRRRHGATDCQLHTAPGSERELLPSPWSAPEFRTFPIFVDIKQNEVDVDEK